MILAPITHQTCEARAPPARRDERSAAEQGRILERTASASVRRLSLVSGESMSSIISCLFESNLEYFDQMSELLEQAADIRAEMPEHGHAFLRSAFFHISEDIDQQREQKNTLICGRELQIFRQLNL